MEEGRFKNTDEAREYIAKNPIPIIQRDRIASSGDLVALIQTEDDIVYSLENGVHKFTHIKFNGKLITDQKEIQKILGD